MPRPKGSKNKKTLEREPGIDLKIAELKNERAKLESEKQNQERIASEAQASIKDLKKSIRKMDTQISHLEIKKAEADAAAAEIEKKHVIGAKVEELINSGKSTEAILDMLSRL